MLIKSNTKTGTSKKDVEARQRDTDRDSLKLALETYLMGEVHDYVFEGISVLLAGEDTNFNKTAKGLIDLNDRQLGVNAEHAQKIPLGVEVVSALNTYRSPQEKANCLKKVVNVITRSLPGEEEQAPVAADDLLPILIAVVIRSDIPNWLTNLNYISNFGFANLAGEETRFAVSSFQAAAEYVETDLRLSSFSDEAGGDQQDTLSELNDSFSSTSGPHVRRRTESTMSSREAATPKKFFEAVSKGSVDKVEAMLASSSKRPDLESLMCHPLCDCAKCQKLLSTKATTTIETLSVYTRDEEGCTALHLAARYGQVGVLKVLLEAGSIINSGNHDGATPLHLACQRNHADTVALLLASPAIDPRLEDINGNTPLHLCAAADHVGCARLLLVKELKGKVRVDQLNVKEETPLHLASKFGYPDMVELLLKAGASLEARNQRYQTPLDVAQNKNVRDVFERHLERLPLPRHTDTFLSVHTTLASPHPLLSMTQSQFSQPQLPLASSLLPPSLPAFRSARSFSGSDTASYYPESEADQPSDDPAAAEELEKLFRSIEEGDLEMVKFRLGAKAVPPGGSAVEDEEERLLALLCHPLCECSKCTVVQELLAEERAKKAKLAPLLRPTIRGPGGLTALHVAAQHGEAEIIKYLVDEREVGVNLRAAGGLTPLHLACEAGQLESIALVLRTYKANPNLLTTQDDSPLHLCRDMEAATLLFRYGGPAPNPNVFNRRGDTPLHVAARRGQADLVSLLLRHGAIPTLHTNTGESPQQVSKTEEVARILASAAETMATSPFEPTLWGDQAAPGPDGGGPLSPQSSAEPATATSAGLWSTLLSAVPRSTPSSRPTSRPHTRPASPEPVPVQDFLRALREGHGNLGLGASPSSMVVHPGDKPDQDAEGEWRRRGDPEEAGDTDEDENTAEGSRPPAPSPSRFLVNEIFAALEGDDLEQRAKLLLSVKSFRRQQKRLRHTLTRDRSNPNLYHLAIPGFEKDKRLRKPQAREAATTPTSFMVLAKAPGEENRVESDSEPSRLPPRPLLKSNDSRKKSLAALLDGGASREGSSSSSPVARSGSQDSLGFPSLFSQDDSGQLFSPTLRPKDPAKGSQIPDDKERRRFSLFS